MVILRSVCREKSFFELVAGSGRVRLGFLQGVWFARVYGSLCCLGLVDYGLFECFFYQPREASSSTKRIHSRSEGTTITISCLSHRKNDHSSADHVRLSFITITRLLASRLFISHKCEM